MRTFKALVFIGITALLMSSCGQETTSKDEKTSEPVVAEEMTGEQLMKLKCWACHGGGTSHDSIIAPPMIAVKKRYMMQFKEMENFTDAIVQFAMDPNEDKAKMFGAVNRFKVMPKQPFEEDELRKIAQYIYENEIEQPDWFDDHFNEMHPDGNMMNENQKGMQKKGMGKGSMN
jgi:cytochrome c2